MCFEGGKKFILFFCGGAALYGFRDFENIAWINPCKTSVELFKIHFEITFAPVLLYCERASGRKKVEVFTVTQKKI